MPSRPQRVTRSAAPQTACRGPAAHRAGCDRLPRPPSGMFAGRVRQEAAAVEASTVDMAGGRRVDEPGAFPGWRRNRMGRFQSRAGCGAGDFFQIRGCVHGTQRRPACIARRSRGSGHAGRAGAQDTPKRRNRERDRSNFVPAPRVVDGGASARPGPSAQDAREGLPASIRRPATFPARTRMRGSCRPTADRVGGVARQTRRPPASRGPPCAATGAGGREAPIHK